ncbi:cupin domain-containing protein [Rhodocytophaga aerolata]|uniref:Cupin domain-containing protein n=1 Tax=Rhodocytophaga aerolata TaxID=455078 RepID=A0ABT8QY13_9BACT|nr:cupin domain-containing protein [Rhodocytophaga aerolata]MDO1444735.1 cupin domain-containing protein [Rhodocytophaga aerolata]
MQATLTQEVLHNPHTGDKLIFLQDAASTGGTFLEVEAIYQPSKEFAPEHFHPFQQEEFTVLSGKLMTNINGTIREYTAGESFTIPAGTPHGMYNAGTEEARFRWKISPAFGTELFFKKVYQAANQPKQPGLADMLWIIKDFQKEIVFTKIPPRLQPFIFRFILPLLRKRR